MTKAPKRLKSEIAAVVCFSSWFLLYITFRYLPYICPDITAWWVKMATVFLNLVMALIITIYSIHDRYQAFKQSGNKIINQFYPLGFAIFPLSAVLWDLGEKLQHYSISVSLIFLMLSLVCMMETAFLCDDQSNIRVFYWRFIPHLLLTASLMLASIIVVYQREWVNTIFFPVQ